MEMRATTRWACRKEGELGASVGSSPDLYPFAQFLSIRSRAFSRRLSEP